MPKLLKCRGPIIPNDLKWIYDWLEYDSICPNDISKVISEARNENDSVILRINSPGGYVSAGAEMYEELKTCDVHIEARIVGDCCSAATYLVCGANESTMSPLGQFMIHRCQLGGVSGNVNDLESYLQNLNETDRAIALAYSIKTRKTQEEILQLMDKETWMSPQSALENGFIDRILFTDEINLDKSDILNISSIINSDSHLIDENIISELQKNKKNYMDQQKNNADFLNAKNTALAKLNLLKLGGK